MLSSLRLLAWVLALSAALGAYAPAEARLRGQSAKQAKQAKPAKPAKPAKLERQSVAGGSAWRLKTKAGPVWVYAPPGYNRATAGVVAYVHGYNVTLDEAWSRHALASQFRDSRQNALFVVPEAPKSNAEHPRWTSLDALLGAVRAAGIRTPGGPAVAVAHSGGFRTVATWLDEARLAQVILLDGLYGASDAFARFARTGGKRLVLVGEDTAEACDKLLTGFKRAARLPRIPNSVSDLPASAKRARVLYLRSQYNHGAIVDGRKTIPLLLRLTPLRARAG